MDLLACIVSPERSDFFLRASQAEPSRFLLLAQAVEKRLDNGRVELKADPAEVAEGNCDEMC